MARHGEDPGSRASANGSGANYRRASAGRRLAVVNAASRDSLCSSLMKLRLLLVVACLVRASASAQPAGYHVGAPVVLPDSLVEVLAHGRFRASVLRVAANANEGRLIATAEQLYPTPDAIIAVATTTAQRKKRLAT